MEAIHFTDAEKSAFRAAYAPAGTTDEQWALDCGNHADYSSTIHARSHGEVRGCISRVRWTH